MKDFVIFYKKFYVFSNGRYKDRLVVKYNLKCDFCEKHFEKLALTQKSNLHFCSRSCAMQSPKTWKKREQSCVEKFGTTTNMLVPSVRQKKENTMLARYGEKAYTSTQEFKSKREKTWMKNFGVAHPWMDVDFHNQSMIASAKIKEENANSYWISKPELDLVHRLGKFFAVEQQKALNEWNFDVFLPEVDIFIQLDGVHWHGHTKSEKELQRWPSIQKKVIIDRAQNEFFLQNSLRLYRVSDIFFLKNREFVVHEIRELSQTEGQFSVIRIDTFQEVSNEID